MYSSGNCGGKQAELGVKHLMNQDGQKHALSLQACQPALLRTYLAACLIRPVGALPALEVHLHSACNHGVYALLTAVALRPLDQGREHVELQAQQGHGQKARQPLAKLQEPAHGPHVMPAA